MHDNQFVHRENTLVAKIMEKAWFAGKHNAAKIFTFYTTKIKLVHFLVLTKVEKHIFHILYQSVPQSPPPWIWIINEKVNITNQKGKFAPLCSKYKHQEHLKEQTHEPNPKLFLKFKKSLENKAKQSTHRPRNQEPINSLGPWSSISRQRLKLSAAISS